MTQPRDAISIVLKHGADLDAPRIRELNDVVFGPLVSTEVLDRQWSAGHAGTYDHVAVPTYRLGSTLLVGDAAHGFEGTGDLINIGISSIGSLPELLARHDIPRALRIYDETVGSSLRAYSGYALRRSLEMIDFEVVAFELGALSRLSQHHPSLWGIFEEGFEIRDYMARYERGRRRIRKAAGVLAAVSILIVAFAGTRLRS